MWSALQTAGQWSGEIWNRHKNGELYAEIPTISAVRNEEGQTLQYVALFTDITAHKEHERQLEHIAHFDALTGLPNRVLLGDRLQQAMLRCNRQNHSPAVAFLDLDGFKAINDAYGHDVGDDLLIAVGQRMKSELREEDSLACRPVAAARCRTPAGRVAGRPRGDPVALPGTGDPGDHRPWCAAAAIGVRTGAGLWHCPPHAGPSAAAMGGVLARRSRLAAMMCPGPRPTPGAAGSAAPRR